MPTTLTRTEKQRLMTDGKPAPRKSIGTLLGDLKDDCVTLVKSEFKLAKQKVEAKVARTSKYTAIIAAGGIVASSGFTTTLLAAGLFMALAFGGPAALQPVGWGLLSVGLIATAIGGVVAFVASRRMPDGPLVQSEASVPAQALGELTEDAAEVVEEVQADS